MTIGSITPAPASFPDIHRFEVAADGLGRYDILVGLPARYDQSDRRYPVVYVTDGQLLFWDSFGAIRFQSLGAGPAAIVVAVGYPPDEGLSGWFARRNFDFTPGPWDMTDELGQLLVQHLDSIKAAEGRSDAMMRAGGADRFLAFLRDDLDPAIRATYRVDDSKPALVGDSSGGCFVLHTVFSGASPFDKYVCVSPTSSLANGAVLRMAESYLSANRNLAARLFLCAGSEEMKTREASLMGFVSSVTRLTELLMRVGYPSLELESQIMDGESHLSIFPRAVMQGLLHVFGKSSRAARTTG